MATKNTFHRELIGVHFPGRQNLSELPHFMKRILIPLPGYGFDPTETAIPWKILTDNRHQVLFATPTGNMAKADMRMLNGKGLGVWKKLLMARLDALAAYSEMERAEWFSQPIRYDAIQEKDFDAILLP